MPWSSPAAMPPPLPALDAGDIDLAAVGSDAVLRAAAKGQPFRDGVFDDVESNASACGFAGTARARGVKPSDPLEKRLSALKGATVGVAAAGGNQDIVARWLATKAGLDPKTDVKFAQIGNPVALQAALENKQIDAFRTLTAGKACLPKRLVPASSSRPSATTFRC